MVGTNMPVIAFEFWPSKQKGVWTLAKTVAFFGFWELLKPGRSLQLSAPVEARHDMLPLESIP